ncbi:MAG: deoxyribose-phosphate aldolase [Ruminococcaceae bacterium]|nr:deoxyribose-phosphate aldolase [Oscillospiraceae bacterium]
MRYNMKKYTVEELAYMVDHTQLAAYAMPEAFEKLCKEAVEYGFHMVAINSVQTEFCAKLLKGTGVHVGAAIAFPLGQCTIKTKMFETADAIENGADEIDYVLNIPRLIAGDRDYIRREMEEIVGICREAGVISKVIFENCYLAKDQIVTAAEIAREVRPDFIKTSTGFGTGGATVEDVALMKKTVGDLVKVKAAGGIRTPETMLAMVEAGAERIGTSSGVKIIDILRGKENNSVSADY